MSVADPAPSLRRPVLSAVSPPAAGASLEAVFLKSIFAELTGTGTASTGKEVGTFAPAPASKTSCEA